MNRLAIVVALAAIGCAPRMVGRKTVVSKQSEVIDLKADAATGSAWVTFRNTTIEGDFAVMEDPANNSRSLRLYDQSKKQRDVVWLCRAEAGAEPRCSRARFDDRPLPRPQVAPVEPVTPSALSPAD